MSSNWKWSGSGLMQAAQRQPDERSNTIADYRPDDPLGVIIEEGRTRLVWCVLQVVVTHGSRTGTSIR
jgi:hypothetical protein